MSLHEVVEGGRGTVRGLRVGMGFVLILGLAVMLTLLYKHGFLTCALGSGSDLDLAYPYVTGHRTHDK